MEVYRRSSWRMLILLNFLLFSTTLQGVQGEVELDGPSESECRPYIEKALKQFEAGDTEHVLHGDNGDSGEDLPTVEITTDEQFILDDHEEEESDTQSNEIEEMDENQIDDNDEDDDDNNNDDNKSDDDNNDDIFNTSNTEDTNTSNESEEQNTSTENVQTQYEQTVDELEPQNEDDVAETSLEQEQNDEPNSISEEENPDEDNTENDNDNVASDENKDEQSYDTSREENDEVEFTMNNNEDVRNDEEIQEMDVDNDEDQEEEHDQDQTEEYKEHQIEQELEQIQEDKEKEEVDQNDEVKINENSDVTQDNIIPENVILIQKTIEPVNENVENKHGETQTEASKYEEVLKNVATEITEEEEQAEEDTSGLDTEKQKEEPDVEELLKSNEEDFENLRPRDHIAQLLKLDTESQDVDNISERTSEIVLKELKKLYDNAIKPLETLYKYRDLSNRHFGDSEIFSKPLILFMGPWSGGKSTIINYLLDIEHSELNLHTGAEPSPAYFNILMYGQEPEILDGTELAAHYTFSGLQKFGQGLEERLRGYKFPNKLLEKVNIVEIPGILEVRKQVSRIFPFNDACQWFIDRADVIFLVYDPSKLDVGPETEAILDQLKGREHQTRIVLNKADQVKPEELMRVQGALIWNISPLMSSAQPPVMYTTSLWSQPYEQWAPVRLLQAQERAFLRDLRTAIDKRIDNKIASARRFAVRVRNHAKMVDCYLTTYYNHKSVFGNRKQVSDEIINHPQDYHIYEGLSTLTNISRYDLPDPDVYKDFFRLNALYDFQKLSATCTYFRGCPINRLDVAIAYDLPELVGKHKRLIEAAFSEADKPKTPGS